MSDTDRRVMTLARSRQVWRSHAMPRHLYTNQYGRLESNSLAYWWVANAVGVESASCMRSDLLAPVTRRAAAAFSASVAVDRAD